MNLGEKVTHEGAGIVCGEDTGRVIAKFSHESEAESFCELVNGEEEERCECYDIQGFCDCNVCEV